MITHITVGLLIGLTGSFHCIGMCGPLALSLPLNHESRVARLASIFLYNIGRAFTYFILGFSFGAIGSSLFLTGYQQALSIGIGLIILIILLFGNRISTRVSILNSFHAQIKIILSALLRKEKNVLTYLLIGLANGLLPCGLVYLAIASAVATGTAWGGGVFMLSFGLGTIPLMFGMMVAGRYISLAVR